MYIIPDRMIKAETFTRSAQPEKGYRAKTAVSIFKSYATVHTVEFWERGGSNQVSATAQPGTACYVMSTGGKWGKSARMLIHHTDSTAAAGQQKQERIDSVWTPEMRALAAELEQGNEYRLFVGEEYIGRPRFALKVNSYPGSFTYTDGCNGCVLRTPEDVRAFIARDRRCA